MTPGAYALYLGDDIVGPALELLRRICQPRSRSLPHVTVRYAKREIPEFGEFLYDQVWIDHLYLSGPGTFNSNAKWANELSTVFVRCESDQLERLSYKPDFPDSVFHLTVYDGKPSGLASSVYRTMEEFEWDFYVNLPPSHVEQIRKRVSSPTSQMPYLTVRAGELLRNVSQGRIEAGDLLRLDDDDRLILIRRVCADLHSRAGRQSRRGTPANLRSYDSEHLYRQGELWSSLELINEFNQGSRKTFGRQHLRDKGLFLTPPEIADDIVSFAVSLLPPDHSIYFGDPALGSGIFVAALVGVAGLAVIASALGVEADRDRAALTAGRWRHIGLEVIGDDFLDRRLSIYGGEPDEHAWVDSRRNLIVANPPYVRFQNIDAKRAQVWRRAIERTIGLTPDVRCDLYVYFVLGCHSWLDDDGIAAWLLPTEFMFTNYGQILREYLSEHVELLRVHMYGVTSQFSNARVSSCVVVYRKRTPDRAGVVRWTSGGTVGNPRNSRVIDRRELRLTKKWQRLFVDPVATSAAGNPTVGDLFRVGRGVATGSNKHFVIDDSMIHLLEIPEKWRKPVLPKAFELRQPIIDSDEFGRPTGVPYRWLIDCDVPIEAISSEAATFAQYLKDIEPVVKLSTLVRRRHPFYRQEANSPPRFVFIYMARRTGVGGRFRLNRSRAVALNNFLCLYPKPQTEAWLNLSADNEEFLLQILEQAASVEVVPSGREYADGLIKLEPRELRDMELSGLPEDLEFRS